MEIPTGFILCLNNTSGVDRRIKLLYLIHPGYHEKLNMKKQIIYWLGVVLLVACEITVPEGEPTDQLPPVFPDYMEVTVPPNIAPLNFMLTTPCKTAYAVFSCGTFSFSVKAATDGVFSIPGKKWKQVVAEATGRQLDITVYAEEERGWVQYLSFPVYVAEEPVDPYIAYRLIEPGYELWNRMGIYQRHLESYDETAIMENKSTHYNCVNCHSFCMQDPDQMLFHMRGSHQATIVVKDGKVEKLNTKTDQTVSPLVYPSWHPSGRYVAFSVNDTKQTFHSNDRNRIEVFDLESDVVVYDTEKHEILTSSLLSSKDYFETFPTFSPDGKRLYFCTADAHPMPFEYDEVKYSLCSVSFNPVTRTFGTEVDTLYHAGNSGKSVSFPRISPDGNYLMYTLAGYGNFSIWHKDADLYMVDLSSGEHYPLHALNSPDVESYHSWSSNSRWVIFSSRRIDGLYTRPYIAYIDDQGQPVKPFLLPRKDPGFYDRLMKSYNIPEFITGKVKNRQREISLTAKKDKGIDVKFVN